MASINKRNVQVLALKTNSRLHLIFSSHKFTSDLLSLDQIYHVTHNMATVPVLHYDDEHYAGNHPTSWCAAVTVSGHQQGMVIGGG